MRDEEFNDLIRACVEIATHFPEGLIFIGGIAVYLHSVNLKDTVCFAEFTHDADFYISLADMADLRDIEEVTANRRLSKHQLVKSGFEFDIYTERHSALVVPYDQVVAHSQKYDAIRVASLEHLLVLKLEACLDRLGSSKGQKDVKDIIRIILVAIGKKSPIRPDLVLPYFRDEHYELMKKIKKGAEFLSMAKGNAKLAKDLRGKFAEGVGDFVKEVY